MRRSKRKASAVATERLSTSPYATAADASATNTEVEVEDDENFAECETSDMSDNENNLHGPCNVRPSDADEDPRFVSIYTVSAWFFLIYLPTMQTHKISGLALLVDILQRSLLSTLMTKHSCLLVL